MTTIGLHKIKGPINRIINYFSFSKYSHVSINIDGIIYDSRWIKGVQKTTLYPIKEDIDFFSIKLSKKDERKLKLWLEKQVGKKYDYFMVINFLTRNEENRKNKEKWFCSELIAAALSHINKEVLPRAQNWEIKPGDFLYSVLLK